MTPTPNLTLACRAFCAAAVGPHHDDEFAALVPRAALPFVGRSPEDLLAWAAAAHAAAQEQNVKAHEWAGVTPIGVLPFGSRTVVDGCGGIEVTLCYGAGRTRAVLRVLWATGRAPVAYVGVEADEASPSLAIREAAIAAVLDPEA